MEADAQAQAELVEAEIKHLKEALEKAEADKVRAKEEKIKAEADLAIEKRRSQVA